MFIEAPGEGISSCRSKGPNGETIARTCDYVLASRYLQDKIKNMDVVEDFESGPHKAVTCLVERDKVIQELRELKMPQAWSGYSSGNIARKKQG